MPRSFANALNSARALHCAAATRSVMVIGSAQLAKMKSSARASCQETEGAGSWRSRFEKL